MLPNSCGDATIGIERRVAGEARSGRAANNPAVRHRIGAGVIGSLVLHVTAVLLLVLALPNLLRAPPAEMLVPVDLVRLGDRTASPPAPDKAALPQEKAQETASADAA